MSNKKEIRGPRGLTVQDVLDLVDDNLPEGAHDAMCAEMYGTDIDGWIDALIDHIEAGNDEEN